MVSRGSTVPVFILAGGQGERLAPLTEAKPKPAVSFGGTHRILDFTLSNCVNSGLGRIFVLTQYQREPLHDYIRDLSLSKPFQQGTGDEVRCISPVSGKRYRGTADAVFQNLPLIRFDSAEHVMVASGDQIYTMDYRHLLSQHVASGADLTIGTVRRPVHEASAFGVIETAGNGTVVGFREKPPRQALPTDGEVLVNMAVYVFRREVLLDIAEQANPMEIDFGHHIIPRLLQSGKVMACDVDRQGRHYWRDVGTLDSYYKANMELVGPSPLFDPERDPAWPIHTLEGQPVFKSGQSRISPSAVIASGAIRESVISCGARIEAGAIVENSVVLPGARVARGAMVRNAIVTEGAVVPAGCRVGEDRHADGSRYLLTPEGVVVVTPPRRIPYERTLVADGRQAAQPAA